MPIASLMAHAQLELLKGLSVWKPGVEHSGVRRASVRYPSHCFRKAELLPSEGSNQSVPMHHSRSGTGKMTASVITFFSSIPSPLPSVSPGQSEARTAAAAMCCGCRQAWLGSQPCAAAGVATAGVAGPFSAPFCHPACVTPPPVPPRGSLLSSGSQHRQEPA